MTVGLDEAGEATEATETDDDEWRDDDAWLADAPPAGWWQRAAAFGIDVLLGLGLLAVLLLICWSAPRGGWLWWILLVAAGLVLLAIGVNRLVLPVVAGWSLGRSVAGIEVVDRDGGQLGPWRLLVRDLAHLLDTLPFCLGWFWPLLDSRHRTFADILTRTEVHQVPGERPDRRLLAARVLAGAAAASLVIAAVGFFAVLRHQQAVAAARESIADDGPALVSDMLSYTAKTAADDFAHAQTLVTDGYRPELIKQQEAVQKNGLVDNDYWVSNSAVLSATEDRASMLLLLQGQRGVAPTQRFVTASVRADYEKNGDGWQVSNVTVLTSPKPAPKPEPAKPEPAKPEPAKPEPATPEPPKSEPEKPGPPKSEPAKPTPPKPAPPKPAPPSGGGR